MKSPLSYTEAEAVAAELARRWHGITGQPSENTPAPEQLADLVQFVMRKGQETVEGRGG